MSDNTLKNATRGKLEGAMPKGVYGGIPFPLPKTGEEVPILPRRVMTFKASNVLKQKIIKGHTIARKK